MISSKTGLSLKESAHGLPANDRNDSSGSSNSQCGREVRLFGACQDFEQPRSLGRCDWYGLFQLSASIASTLCKGRRGKKSSIYTRSRRFKFKLCIQSLVSFLFINTSYAVKCPLLPPLPSNQHLYNLTIPHPQPPPPPILPPLPPLIYPKNTTR